MLENLLKKIQINLERIEQKSSNEQSHVSLFRIKEKFEFDLIF
jgi:hypothetical protein